MLKRTKAPIYRERIGISRGSTHSRLLWRRIATNTIYKERERERENGITKHS